MEYIRDNENAAHVMLFDSLTDILSSTRANLKEKNCPPSYRQFANGKRLDTFDKIEEASFTASDEIGMVDEITQEVLLSGLPQPKSRKRRRFWNDDCGDHVCSDRWMTGEPFQASYRREVRNGPSTVSIIANLDSVAGESTKVIGWRTAGACVMADVLEQAGYNVDIHMWCRGDGVFSGKCRGQFTAMQVKRVAEPLDMGRMMSVLSSWFCRSALFGSFCTAPVANPTLGGMNSELGPFAKYMSCEGDKILYMPIVRNKEGAVGAVTAALTEFIEAGDYDLTIEDWEDWARGFGVEDDERGEW